MGVIILSLLGCLIPKCCFSPIKRFAPIMTLRRNPEFGNQHPDYRLERNAARCDVKLVQVDFVVSDCVALDVERRRYVQMRMIRPFEVQSRLPVINQQLFEVVIEEPVLIHAGCHPPLMAEPDALCLDDREDMCNIKEQPAWSTGRRPKGNRVKKGDRMVRGDGVGVRGHLETLGGNAADSRSQCLKEEPCRNLRCSCGGQRASASRAAGSSFRPRYRGSGDTHRRPSVAGTRRQTG